MCIRITPGAGESVGGQYVPTSTVPSPDWNSTRRGASASRSTVTGGGSVCAEVGIPSSGVEAFGESVTVPPPHAAKPTKHSANSVLICPQCALSAIQTSSNQETSLPAPKYYYRRASVRANPKFACSASVLHFRQLRANLPQNANMSIHHRMADPCAIPCCFVNASSGHPGPGDLLAARSGEL